ncbi:MAG: 7-carboxy-7-deazaguanine synthase [Pseudohongiellaceae bacterium]|jgi:7-carboxy-7-deazaguanine synthase
MTSSSLRITEIFHSLQGESRTMGLPTVFVRLTGCPLRCQYCDTAYAFEGGQQTSIDAIVQEVAKYRSKYVTVTGGEPLAQPNCIELLSALSDEGYQVSLETSGSLGIAGIDPRVSIVLDLKTPGSDECDRNKMSNIALLKKSDQVKFVICNHNDYLWSKAKVDELDLRNRVDEILFSPSHEELKPEQLAHWVLEDSLQVRVQIQLHKYLWGTEQGR